MPNNNTNGVKTDAKCIVFYNQKGGVSKTTSAVCCAQILGEVYDKNVLLIDFDSQGSASMMSNINIWENNGEKSIGTLTSAYAIRGERASIDDILDCVTRGSYKKSVRRPGGTQWDQKEIEYDYDILPVRGIDLSISELALHNPNNYIYKHVNSSFFILKMIIDTLIKECDYDFILVDANPSLSSFALNALFASDYLIVPTTMTPEAVSGISSIFARLEELNLVYPYFEPLGILYQRYSDHRTLDKLILNNTVFEPFETKIPDINTRVSKSINDKILPVCKTDKAYKVFRGAYIDLCKEIMERIELKEKQHGKLERVFL
jgi:chromosome partitioning protein